MNLLLIDNRVSQPDFVVNACLPNSIPIIFNYETDTVESILEKIPNQQFDSLGIFQENYAQSTYQFLASMPQSTLGNVIETDPTFSSWSSLVDFFRQIREKTGITAIDFMGCNIGADANWARVIEYIQTTLGVSVASSVDATGSESLDGNWILETANVDLVGKYFTEGIRGYEFILGATSTHTLILNGNREVYAAGSNTSGCCGLGSAYSGYSTVNEFMRVPVSGITGVSYGTNTSYLLTASGNVLVCGANANGQLGLGNTTAQADLSFVRTDATTRLGNVSSVAAGGSHSVFLLTDGSALACGLNTNGQLGDGTLTQRTFPVKLAVSITTPAITPLSGYSLLAYYKFDGNLKNEISGTTPAGGTFSSSIVKSGTQSVGTTTRTTFYIEDVNKSSGTSMTVSVWFYYTGTRFANGWFWVTSTSDGFRGLNIDAAGNITFLSGTYYTVKTSLPTNEWHHIAIVGSSSANQTYLYYDGSLTNTITGNSFSPTQLYSQTIIGFANLDGVTGYMDDMRFYEAALSQSDIQYIYNNPNIPTETQNAKKVSYISAGDSHTLLTDISTNVFSCGLNVSGQLGIGTLTSSSSAMQVKTNASTNLTGISQAVAGGSHSLALTTTGSVYSWGANTSGQLGINSNTDASYATFVLTPASATLTNITQVAAGTSHSLFLTASGTVFACGLNTSGELGNGTTTSSNQLVSVLNPAGTAALSGITRISATANTSFFLNSLGVLFACGSNASNQMGFPNSGATTFYTLPVQLSLVDFGKAKTAGYTPIYNRLQGAEPWQQQYYGVSTLDFANSGYTSTQLSTIGITATTLKNAGASYRGLLNAGIPRNQLAANYVNRNLTEGARTTTGYLMENSILDPPSGFTITGRTANSLTVGTITAPTGATASTSYNVLATPVTGGTAVNTNATAGSTISGLDGGKIYNVRMRSVNAAGNSAYGPAVQNSTSLAALPTLTAGSITSNGMTITFSPALPTQDCSYVLRTNPGATQYVLAAGATEQTLSGLASGTSHNIFLDASNAYTSASATTSATTGLPIIYDIGGITQSSTLSGSSTIAGIAFDASMSRAVQVPQSGSISLSTYNGTSWSAFTNFDGGTSRTYGGVALTDDGGRGVACVQNGRIYYFTWTGSTYSSLTAISDTNTRGYTSIGITSNGSRIITCVNNGLIYFANWSGSDYTPLTATLNGTSLQYYGINISRDGSRIAYGAASFTNPTYFATYYYATWNGSNYSTNNLIETVTGGYPRSSAFSSDAGLLWLGKFTDANVTLQYTYWDSSTSSYRAPINTVPSSIIPGNGNPWGLWTNPTTSKLVIANYGDSTFRIYNIPVLTSPTQISGSILWLDATDSATLTVSGSNVTQWNDKSTNAKNMTASVGAGPTIASSQLNGKNMLNFASNKGLTNGSISMPLIYTIFTVAYTSQTGYSRILDKDSILFIGSNGANFTIITGQGTWGTFYASGISRTTPSIVAMTNNGGTTNSLNAYINGTQYVTNGNGLSLTFTGLNVGYNGTGSDQYWNGFIGEIIIYNSILSTTNINTITNYLKSKWGIA